MACTSWQVLDSLSSIDGFSKLLYLKKFEFMKKVYIFYIRQCAGLSFLFDVIKHTLQTFDTYHIPYHDYAHTVIHMDHMFQGL